MPVLIAWIGEMLLSQVGQMALSMLISLGIGFAASAVASGVISSSSIASEFSGAGALTQWVGVLRIDTAITVILSAWAGRRIVDAARVHFAKLSSSSSGGE